jgi:hypothetical protein
MHGLPEEWQKLVRETLAHDPQPKAAAPTPATIPAPTPGTEPAAPAPAPPTALDAFFESFFFAEEETTFEYRFVDRTAQLEAAFPDGTWSEFTIAVTGLSDYSLSPVGASGFDLAEFRAYLEKFSRSGRSTITLAGQ